MNRDAPGIQLPHLPKDRVVQSRYRGCLLGGAVGDALGAPLEFMSTIGIRRTFGDQGIQEYVHAFGRLGAITDDTQLTLFTAEGMLRACVRDSLRGLCHGPSVMSFAYQRWLRTQGIAHALHEHCMNGWLIEHQDLFTRRAPGSTCLSSLQEMRQPGDVARNDSKGCGAATRVAPIGMFYGAFATDARDDPGRIPDAFDFACEVAALTHGHPTAQLTAGYFAGLVSRLVRGVPLRQAIDDVMPALSARPHSAETVRAIEAALSLAEREPCDPRVLKQLGRGWAAHEALAIALYCALCARDFRGGVQLAVNHGGDSDSTGSMVGQILGAIHGDAAIPRSWLDPLELRDLITAVADDLLTVIDWEIDPHHEASKDRDFYRNRYPGG